ncbi:MAG: biotin/lipoyl-containing protein [Bacteroidaceae bacterium]
MKEYKYKINGNTFNVVINEIDESLAKVEVNGTSYNVELARKKKSVISRPALSKAKNAPSQAAPSVTKPASTTAGHGVKSPLPGVIISIKCAVGDSVKKGDVIVVLEAMKMENNINADSDGVITAIPVKQGQSVLEGTDLVVLG